MKAIQSGVIASLNAEKKKRDIDETGGRHDQKMMTTAGDERLRPTLHTVVSAGTLVQFASADIG